MDLEEGEIIISDVSSEDDLQPLFKGYRIQDRKSNLLRPESDEPTPSLKTSRKEKSSGVRSYYLKGQVRESVKDKNVCNTYKSRCVGGKIGIGKCQKNKYNKIVNLKSAIRTSQCLFIYISQR